MQTLSSWENCTQIDTALNWWEGIQALLFRCPWRRLAMFDPSWGQLPPSPNTCSFFQLGCQVQPLSPLAPCCTLQDAMPGPRAPCSALLLQICCFQEDLLEVTQSNFFTCVLCLEYSFLSGVKDLFHQLETTMIIKKTKQQCLELVEIHLVILLFVNQIFSWDMVSCWSVIPKYYNNYLFFSWQTSS